MLKRHKLSFLIMFSIFLPFLVCAFTAPYGIGLLNRLVGVGSCSNMLLISFSLIVSCGGMYGVKIFIILCQITLTAIAWSPVLRVILLWGMSFLITIETPSEALRLVNMVVAFVTFYVNVIVCFEESFLKADNDRLQFVTNKSSSLLLALILRQFH